jgi:hypothetical protein
MPDGYEPRLVSGDGLAAGMLLDQDVADLKGELVFGRGLELNTLSIRRLLDLGAVSGKKARWRVLVPPADKLAFAKILDG